MEVQAIGKAVLCMIIYLAQKFIIHIIEISGKLLQAVDCNEGLSAEAIFFLDIILNSC